jgi:hypothetical protein
MICTGTPSNDSLVNRWKFREIDVRQQEWSDWTPGGGEVFGRTWERGRGVRCQTGLLVTALFVSFDRGSTYLRLRASSMDQVSEEGDIGLHSVREDLF